MKEDLYRILGVPRNADESEIRSAHRALAKKYHPDAGTGSSGERFRSIQDAYDVLSDPHRRAEYDSSLGRQEQRAVRTEPSVRFYPGQTAPFSAHVDLRHLSRGVRAEPIEFGSRTRFARGETDPWEDLLVFLFGDLE
jgi:curved DNA-binding protein CbpA